MGKLDNRVAIVTGAAQGIGRRSRKSSRGEGATVVGADIQTGTTMRGRTSRQVKTTSRGWSRTPSPSTEARRPRERGCDRPVHALGRGRLRRMAADHVGEPRRHLPHRLPRADADAGGALRADRQHRVERRVAGTPNLAHYVASKGGVWAFTRALARELGPARHHGQLGRPRPDGDRRRARRQARGGLRVRPDAAGGSRGGAVAADIAPGGRVPRIGGGGLGDRTDDRRRRRPHPTTDGARRNEGCRPARGRATSGVDEIADLRDPRRRRTRSLPSARRRSAAPTSSRTMG